MIVALIAGGYLLGSIPVAWLVTRLVTGRDLRDVGSGNVGVMNVMLSVSRWAGLLVFAAEAAKGILAVTLARSLSGDDVAVGAAVVATVVGTRRPMWLRLQGGRGNTAGLGALVTLSWPMLLIGLAVWGLARVLTGTSFWATRISFGLAPFLFGFLTQSWEFGLFAAALAAIYLRTQEKSTDDHLIIRERWPSFWVFLTGPPRKRG